LYQLMTTVSILLDDIRSGVDTLCRAIAIPEPRPQSYRGGAVFCRVHTKYAVAPTFLELIAPPASSSSVSEPIDPFGLGKSAARQGSRRIKWHATELAMPESQMLDLAAHLEQRDVPVGFVPPDRRERFFIGGDPSSDEYDPSFDGGLLIEAGRSGHLGLPDDAFSAPADIPDTARPGTMIRIVARDYLVDDLDTTLALLERNLRWTPASVTEDGDCRRAVLPFSVPRSARLELVQPRRPGPVADAYDELGPGAWTIRISVVDLDAKAEDLRVRGTPFVRQPASLRTDPSATLGVPFEFVPATA
jgi:hypothetical protein